MPHDVTLKLLASYGKMQRNELSEQDAATAYSQHIVDEYIKPGLSKINLIVYLSVSFFSKNIKNFIAKFKHGEISCTNTAIDILL